MTKNVGGIDRILRIVVGLVLIAYALNLIAPDTGYNVWGWIGVVPLLTALINFCPLYKIIGLSTSKEG
jgi:multidrug transporter EmrE-like cation transporter